VAGWCDRSAAVLCRRLYPAVAGTAIATAFGLRCLGIIMETHLPDIMPRLQAKQGVCYHLRAYVAFSLRRYGVTPGVLCYRRKTQH